LVVGEDAAFEGDGEGVECGLPSVSTGLEVPRRSVDTINLYDSGDSNLPVPIAIAVA